MKKTYVLDTNILLSDPNSIYSFGDNDVVIPAVCLSELDSKKKQMDEVGYSARNVARELDNIRKGGKLHLGVPIRTGGTIRIITHNPKSPVFEKFIECNNDDAIISVAYDLTISSPDTEVILLSKDVLVRIKADTVSVASEDYQNDKVATCEDELYAGYDELFVDDDIIDYFYKNKYLNMEIFDKYPENHMFVLKSNANVSKSAVCRKKNGDLIPLYNYTGEPVFGTTTHRNVQQMMALDLLLDDDIKIVTMTGKAGTGKTLLALAAGLQKTMDEQEYRKVLVGRPIVPMGKDLGYLPGEIEDKMRPWMQPIYDNLEFLFDCKSEELGKILEGYEDIIKVEPLTYIRGRSIPNQFIIMDETQNLSKLEVKTIATRLAFGAKLILVGDPDQIDNVYLDKYSNGLTHFIETMKNEKLVGHITLKRGERSDIAQICADLL